MTNLKTNTDLTLSSEFSSAMKGKCPRCRNGNMFSGPMYGLKFQKMNIKCPHCSMKFEREPGYFYVAMFISYAMNVAEIICISILLWLITGNLENPFLYMAVIFPIVFLLSPVNYKYSRIVLLYWLTPGLHFNPEMNKESNRTAQ
jgi:uncharacterized protein (DUF983 family)